ncbi:MAG TPA: pyridoxamine 5'-phosphate oxidase family protein [Patescibacteria group bacterium]|nr:pyridoxamine 5'-phosphate oxidase family protein [Patescibacteria group bacterium]
MNAEEAIREYLPTGNVMQLATSVDGQPWVCTVHFYSDDNLNLYWISMPDRRHSKEITQNPKVAATIMVHENTKDEPYVIGITIEGTAEFIGEYANEQIGKGYVEKHHIGPEFLSDIQSGKNPNKFYKLKPSNIVMFNNKDFPDNPRQEWTPTS